jgi:hypothetical protein
MCMFPGIFRANHWGPVKIYMLILFSNAKMFSNFVSDTEF